MICFLKAGLFRNFLYAEGSGRQQLLSAVGSFAVDVFKRRNAEMLFEIRDKVVWVKMDGPGHLFDANARMKTAVHKMRNNVQAVHFLRSMLKHLNGNRLKEAAYDLEQHSLLAKPGDNSALLTPID